MAGKKVARECSLPKMRCQKRPSGNHTAYVTLSGVRVYLGEYGTPEAQERYNRETAAWLARGRVLPIDEGDITVGELAVIYTAHIEREYHDSKSVRDRVRLAVKPLNDLYSRLPVREFGPVSLKAVRETMIDARLSLTSVNARIATIKGMFGYGAENELIPGEVFHRVQAVKPLQRGKSRCKPPRVVHPVPVKDVEATLPFLTPSVRAAVQVQRLTGARSSEILNLKARDIDRTGDVWVARLEQHKTAIHGKTRLLCFGPKAQAILKPFLLKRKADEYLFSPKDHFEERKAATRPGKGRRPNQKPNPRKTDHVVGDHYDSAAYGRCIRRACEGAGVTAWFPHQLRHLAATELRALYGTEAARAILGHSSLKTTEVYAEADEQVALKIMGQIG